MDKRIRDALLEFAISGVAGSLHTMRILAERGLVSPGEVEEYAEGLTAHFVDPPGREPDPVSLQLRASFEANTNPLLARIRTLARRTWAGDGPSGSAPRGP